MKNIISCIIVTYHPGNTFNDLIKRLSHEYINIIVVDNSEKPAFINEKKFNLKLFWMGGNKGIASAQNKGIELAGEAKSEFIAFLDQDSKLDASHIIKLVDTIQKSQYEIAAPICFNRKTNTLYPPVKISETGVVKKISVVDNALIETNFVISSGTVVRYSTLKKIGLMDDDLFIDYVDTEWCLRANKLGYNIIINSSIKMAHEIGDGDINCYFFRVPVHSAKRRYYRVRNAFFLFNYSHVPVRLAIREVIITAIQQIIIICCRKNRRRYLKLYFKAVIHGIKFL